MDLIDRIKQLAKRANTLKESIQTEEATKMSLIIPFFQMLGYDVFNPDEFLPEFTADVGIKKGEKVDYAIIIDGQPAILIECKWCGERLESHDSQLFRYFGTTSAKFAILTNGIVYKFYTDLDEANKMDLVPFLEFDLENLRENLIPEIKQFQKDSFNPDSMMGAASELKYSKLIKEYFGEQLKNPLDDFVTYFANQVYEGRKTQAVIEKFTPIVKKALNDFITEKMNEKIKSALDNNAKNDEVVDVQDAPVPPPDKIQTTNDEIEAFYIIKSMLLDIVDPSRVTYKDTETYFGILLDGKTTRWICRIKLDGTKKFVHFPDGEKEQIEALDDLYKLKDRILVSANLRL
ncbi:MAG: type I restriction enzyme HsdR N-terminal domain-containing protein [Oscillospiraceae bacterium]|jgi:hypothetical protein|nr:type I restriction enzyme HsdR N-terminal domain-containing protein [Oscillospiraceae bacterium]